MSGSNSASSAVLPFPRRRVAPLTRAEIDEGVARGRRLQGEAVQAVFGRLLRFLAGGTSLRALRAPAGLPGRRHSCC